MEKLFGIIF